MKDSLWKLIAVAALSVLAVREFRWPGVAVAQAPQRNLYFEPGTVDIPLPKGGNAQGKIVVDLETGETWGFPVFGPKLPFPGFQVSEGVPLSSNPVYLGRFNLNRLNR